MADSDVGSGEEEFGVEGEELLNEEEEVEEIQPWTDVDHNDGTQ